MQALTYIGIVLAIISVIFGMISICWAKMSISFIKVNIDAIKNQNDNAIRSERNERFKDAIEQLGDEKNAIALGGIYTLHRIAKEDESYRENVFNILCSFVRDVTITGEYQAKYTDKPSEPIQTILNILCRNKNDFKIYKKYRINFSNANLIGVNLMDANLVDASIFKANLTSALISYSNLTNAFISYANLTAAYLDESNLTKTNLASANFTGSNLERANLAGANLTGADLTRAKLEGTNLKGANSCMEITFTPISFGKYIIDGIGKPTNLSGIEGGYDENNKPYTGKPLTGSYTKEEAKQMIEDYKNNLK